MARNRHTAEQVVIGGSDSAFCQDFGYCHAYRQAHCNDGCHTASDYLAAWQMG